MKFLTKDFALVDQKVVVRSYIKIDDLFIRPNDILHLAPPNADGLVLFISECDTKLRIGRVFDGNLITADDSTPLSPSRWKILSSISVIERAFGNGVAGKGPWYIALRGAPQEIQSHIDRSAKTIRMEPVYLSDLCEKLKTYTPEASVVVADDYQTAKKWLDKCTPGSIWFVPKATTSHHTNTMATCSKGFLFRVGFTYLPSKSLVTTRQKCLTNPRK